MTKAKDNLEKKPSEDKFSNGRPVSENTLSDADRESTLGIIYEKCSHVVETYEEFCENDILLEQFVDDIEKNAPNGEIDIYSREFWIYYRGYIEKKWNEECFPLIEKLENEFIDLRRLPMSKNETEDKDRYKHMDKLKNKIKAICGYIFSGGATCFLSSEHIQRLKQRTALNMAKKELNLDRDTLELLKQCFKSYRRSNYSINISPQLLEEIEEKHNLAINRIKKDLNYNKVVEFNATLKSFDSLYHIIRFRLMNYGSTEMGKKILESNNQEWSEDTLRKMADSLCQEYNIQNDNQLYSSDKEALLLCRAEKVKKIITGSCEASVLSNLPSKIIDRVCGDDNGYSSAVFEVR